MTLERAKVLQAKRPDKQKFVEALAADWGRVFPTSVRGTAADIMGCSAKTIGNGVSGDHVPEGFTLLCSLLADPTALQATLALFGMKAVPLRSDAANDMDTVAKASHLVGTWAEALADGQRDHNETMTLAVRIRQILPALNAVVLEADRLRGAA